MAGPGRKPPILSKLQDGGAASAGYDLVANILVGLGLVWVVRYFWPSVSVKAYGFGVVLGAVSGFYQLFKTQQRAAEQAQAAKQAPKPDDDGPQRPE